MTVTYAEISHGVPGSAFTYNISGGPGRFVTLGGFGTTYRYDVEAQSAAVVPFNGVLTPDGDGVVTALDASTIGFASVSGGPIIAQASLPFGWELRGLGSTSTDGMTVGVEGINGAMADQAAFVLDLRSGVATKLDTLLPGTEGPDWTGSDSTVPLVSADGNSAAFMFRDGAVGCTGCEHVWLWRRTGTSELVSRSVTGVGPTTGASRIVDIAPDGRYVLYSSTSTDLAGGPGSTNGRLFVRDMASTASAVVPSPIAEGHLLHGSISDDGDRVAFAANLSMSVSGQPVEVPVPHLLDRSSGDLVPLSETASPDDALSGYSNVVISGDGRRVAFTNIGHVVAQVVGG